jgi:hypothetical protein
MLLGSMMIDPCPNIARHHGAAAYPFSVAKLPAEGLSRSPLIETASAGLDESRQIIIKVTLCQARRPLHASPRPRVFTTYRHPHARWAILPASPVPSAMLALPFRICPLQLG